MKGTCGNLVCQHGQLCVMGGEQRETSAHQEYLKSELGFLGTNSHMHAPVFRIRGIMSKVPILRSVQNTDLRIRFQILLFSSVAFKMPTKISFLLKVFLLTYRYYGTYCNVVIIHLHQSLKLTSHYKKLQNS
jgi:hypothetical protein